MVYNLNMLKVVEFVDIAAPLQAVFDTITNNDRRAQLSPLWGVGQYLTVSPDFPKPGSFYRMRLNTEPPTEYTSVVTTFQPPLCFAYCLDVERKTQVRWQLQSVRNGTRLIYEEQFLELAGDTEEFVHKIQQVVHDWLNNIKRYEELRGTRWKRLKRWLYERYYLRMKPDQRRTVQLILYMQAVGFISFVMAAIALGVASLF